MNVSSPAFSLGENVLNGTEKASRASEAEECGCRRLNISREAITLDILKTRLLERSTKVGWDAQQRTRLSRCQVYRPVAFPVINRYHQNRHELCLHLPLTLPICTQKTSIYPHEIWRNAGLTSSKTMLVKFEASIIPKYIVPTR